MKQQYQRWLASILSIVLVICSYPLSVSAEGANEATYIDAEALAGVNTETTITEPISTVPMEAIEIDFLRTENTKHFLMPDGSYQAVSYSGAVHFMGSEGIWQDIDNTLLLTADSSTPSYTDTQGRTQFATTLSQNQPTVTLNEDGYGVSMWLAPIPTGLATMSVDAVQSINEVTAIVNNPSQARALLAQDPSQTAISKLRSSVVYENVLQGLDLEYVLDGRTLKENIIVKAKSDNYCYRFALETDGLYAQLQSDGSVKLYDIITDEEKYIIPTPFMYDAAETVSENVEYQLSQAGGKYYLTVVADAEWINAEERVFPITIDPTIGPVTATQDTYVCEPFPNTSNGSSSHMWVANNSSYWKNATAYISFVLPAIPEGAEIEEAALSTHYYYPDYAHSEYMFVTAHQVLMPWNESTLNWTSANQYQNLGISSTATDGNYIYSGYGAVASSPDELEFDITATVTQWYGGLATNYGISLKHSLGTSLSVMFCSSEAGPSLAPQMTITYSFPKLEDGIYWIKNVGNGRYMDTTDGGKTENTEIQQNALATEDNHINQLYKVQSIGYSQTYTIRPLTNCAMCLHSDPSLGNIVLKNYSITQAWIIFYSEQQRKIFNSGTEQNGYLSTPASSANGDALILSSGTSENSSWEFIPYDGPPINEMSWISATDALDIRDEHHFEASISSTDLAINGPITYRLEGIGCDADEVATLTEALNLVPEGPGFIKVIAEIPGTSHVLQQTVQIEASRSIRLQLYYDDDYQARYPNTYSRIFQEFSTLHNFYLENFNVYILLDGIELHESFAFSCPCDNLNSLCSCYGENCTNAYFPDVDIPQTPASHHSNISCNLSMLAGEATGETTHTVYRILFLGGITCSTEGNAHIEQQIKGKAHNYTKTAVINNLDGADWETKTLIHELGHLLGAIDHYGRFGALTTNQANDNFPDYTFSQTCMYGEERGNADSRILCEGCTGMILDSCDQDLGNVEG